MINSEEFRKYAHEFVDWMADYLESVEKLPVKSQVKPGDIYRQIPDNPPDEGESMDEIFQDFKQIILPGIGERVALCQPAHRSSGRHADRRLCTGQTIAAGRTSH